MTFYKASEQKPSWQIRLSIQRLMGDQDRDVPGSGLHADRPVQHPEHQHPI